MFGWSKDERENKALRDKADKISAALKECYVGGRQLKPEVRAAISQAHGNHVR